MDVYLSALGCRLNEAELQQWSKTLLARGHHTVTDPALADVCVLNTCAVTEEAARKSRKAARRLHRQNPTAHLVLTGCYAALSPRQVSEIAGVDLVVSNQHKDELVTQLEAQFAQDLRHTMPKLAQEPDATPFHAGHTRAFIKVQDGCRNRCSFCIVTIARGDERSRSIDEIVSEINQYEKDGIQEAVLTGVHLGGYGSDLNTSLYDLVQAVLARTTIARVRLSSLEPWDLPPHFFELWQNPRLCQHLHLPLQSGSNGVLKRMARRCNTDSYAALVQQARHHIADVSITTDLIVGFPGETDEHWQQTVAFVEQMAFAHIHIFPFSARAGTAAARMTDVIDDSVVHQRCSQLHHMSAQQKEKHLQNFVGSCRSVLWEAADATGTQWGLTDNYLRVKLDPIGPVDPRRLIDHRNKITLTKLNKLNTDHFEGVLA